MNVYRVRGDNDSQLRNEIKFIGSDRERRVYSVFIF